MLRAVFTRFWNARHLGGGRLRIAVALVMVVAASALFWTSRDYTVVAPEWDGQVRGIAYSPSRLFTERQTPRVRHWLLGLLREPESRKITPLAG